MLPLADVTVLDLSRLLPGPYATMLLADLGARVVKVEGPSHPDDLRHLPPQVAGQNAGFATLNRNKRSLVARLDTPSGSEVLRRLAGRSQVLVESFRPGVLERHGLGFAALSQTNPTLVYCSITGYGQTGPMAPRAGHDLDFLARSGLGSALRQPDGTPVIPGVQFADVAGGMLAALGVLAALHEAARTGRGRHVDISLAEAGGAFTILATAGALAAGTETDPAGRFLSGDSPAYRYYRCRDHRWVAVAAVEPRFQARLRQALELHDVPGDLFMPRADAGAVHRRLEEAFARRDRDEWLALLEGGDACVEPLLEPGEAARDGRSRARGLVREARIPGGRVPQPASALAPTFAPEDPEVGWAAPPAGLHTREVLAELGYGPEQVRALEEDGTVASPPEEAVARWREAVGL